VVHSILLIVWGRALEKELDRMRVHGEPVSILDLKPKPIPDSENGAVIYEQASQAYRSIYDEKMAHGQMNPDIDMGFYVSSSHSPQERAKFEQGARKDVSDYQSIIPLIDEAESRPKRVFKSTGKDDAAWMTVSSLPGMWDFCTLLKARALLEANDGKMQAATDDIIRLIRLSDASRYEPRTTQGQISRLVVLQITLNLLNNLPSKHPLSYEQSKLIFDELDRLSFTRECIRAFQGDRAQFNSYFDASRKDLTTFLQSTNWYGVPVYRAAPFRRISEAELNADMGNPVKTPGRLRRFTDSFINYLWRPFSYRDQLAYLEGIFNQSLTVRNLPYREGAKILARENKKPRSLYVRLTKLPHCAASGSTWIIRDRTIAQRGMAQVAVAVRAYQSRFGDVPSSINDLKKLGWKLPDDPFSGKQFGYHRKAEGFVIYSWGPDLKDNGGGPQDKRKSQDGDIVYSWSR
jgi:hypothetical protein